MAFCIFTKQSLTGINGLFIHICIKSQGTSYVKYKNHQSCFWSSLIVVTDWWLTCHASIVGPHCYLFSLFFWDDDVFERGSSYEAGKQMTRTESLTKGWLIWLFLTHWWLLANIFRAERSKKHCVHAWTNKWTISVTPSQLLWSGKSAFWMCPRLQSNSLSINHLLFDYWVLVYSCIHFKVPEIQS